MRTKTFITNLTGILAALYLFSSAAYTAEFVYRDLKGNTLPSSKCSEKSEATAKASDAYNLHKHTKRFCEVQGYGWHVSEEKDNGKLVCDACSGDSNQGKYQCHLEDVVVTCKRIKPGSVGLIPGQG
ncbi:MAG TPA: hypothetical protein VLU73_09850 [Methylococcaceae bacterium]|nr:hypothetical protein [Methylococcaceae bacterium]